MKNLKEIKLLENWLKSAPTEVEDDTDHYGDLLIPCKNKAPMFPHANNAWSWDLYDQYKKSKSFSKDVFKKDFEIGILCNRLCVIDVDDVEVIKQLEEKFPVLTQPFVPKQMTKRGCHYFFKRSLLADTKGYYNGSSQVIKGVDLKTKCSTGTCSVLITCPSPNKQWIVPPWQGVLIEIPDDLLQAVAKPSPLPEPKLTTKVEIIQFEDGSSIQCKNYVHLLSQCDLFRPFFSTDDDDELFDTNVINIPGESTICSRDILDLHEFIVSKGSIERKSLSWKDVNNVDKLRKTADYVGLDVKIYNKIFDIQTPLNTFQVIQDMWKIDESWTKIVFPSSEKERSSLKQVQGPILYKPLRNLEDDRWLLPNCSLRAIPSDSSILLYDDHNKISNHVWRQIPEFLQHMLKKYPEKIVIAGGWPLGLVSDYVERGKDIDIFINGINHQEANDILLEIVAKIPKLDSIVQSCNAVTITYFDDMDNIIIIQIILRLYENIQSIFQGFDIDSCKIAIVWKETPRLLCTSSWISSMRHLTVWLKYECWNKSTVSRIWKYYTKGFEVFLPGLYRSLFKSNWREYRLNCSNKFNGPGIIDVFLIEDDVHRHLLNHYTYNLMDPTKSMCIYPISRPCSAEILNIVKENIYKNGGKHSGYDMEIDINPPCSIYYAFRALTMNFFRRIRNYVFPYNSGELNRGLRILDAEKLTEEKTPAVMWLPHKYGSLGSFHRSKQRAYLLYDRDEYSTKCSDIENIMSKKMNERSIMLKNGMDHLISLYESGQCVDKKIFSIDIWKSALRSWYPNQPRV